MNMLESELKTMYLYIDNKTIPPIYRYDDFIFDEDIGEWKYIGVVIIKTAQENYEECLYPPEPQPNKMEVRLGQIENALGTLATQVAKNTLLNGGMK